MKRQKRAIHDYLEDILRYTEKAQRFVADWARAVSKVGYVCSTPPSTTQDTPKRQFAHRRRRARLTPSRRRPVHQTQPHATGNSSRYHGSVKRMARELYPTRRCPLLGYSTNRRASVHKKTAADDPLHTVPPCTEEQTKSRF